MLYVEFKNVIFDELRQNPDGLSWNQLRDRLSLPYIQPCQTWLNRLESEDGLIREKGSGREFLWKIKAR